jgi:hypothetical protein
VLFFHCDFPADFDSSTLIRPAKAITIPAMPSVNAHPHLLGFWMCVALVAA